MYLNNDLTESDFQYIHAMKDAGFQEVFTSLHIPEFNKAQLKRNLSALGKLCKDKGLKLTVDMSPSTLQKIGFSLADVESLLLIGITGIRFDYGFSMEQLSSLSKEMFVVLNASTVGEEDILELKRLGANFDNIEAWHNYYPRDETGLSKNFLKGKNNMLKSRGLTTMAFVPGDQQRRGPVYSGLPTLEKHRGHHIVSAAIELLKDTVTDKVFIGDQRISKCAMDQFKALF